MSRVEQRKARTRQALLEAAQAFLASGSTDVSVQQITERADVGLGSFYNHFESKSELFEAAVVGVLEEHARTLLEQTEGMQDPAEVLATRFRLTARLAETSPAVAAVFVNSGMNFLISDQGLAPMARADIEYAIQAGRLPHQNPHLALVATAGCLLGYLQVRLIQPERISVEDADALTERLLVMLGMRSRDAKRLAHKALPRGTS